MTEDVAFYVELAREADGAGRRACCPGTAGLPFLLRERPVAGRQPDKHAAAAMRIFVR